MNEGLKNYLAQFNQQAPPWVQDLQEQAKRDHIPIMEEDGLKFLLQLIQIHQPKRILEIGTAIGYSALRMADAYEHASIVTIEKDVKRHQQAVGNFQMIVDKGCRINAILGDARDILPQLKSEMPFDLIFIDAAKGQYEAYFNEASALLSDTGIIISDNVLFKGYVYDDTQMPVHFRALVKKIRHFNEWVMNHPDFDSTIVPIGDGLVMSRRKS
ncbi:O-methyltransferase [Lentibacillus saliphilus]|uniref:O-methyltransferase n=1 Tax=Lentibacillus saliphilus TaxID=2737028 RepID=UPI001C2F63E9|nr:O-methyltransferase [Lentibacillus saliphilus]